VNSRVGYIATIAAAIVVAKLLFKEEYQRNVLTYQ
jgi:hypothetical protein